MHQGAVNQLVEENSPRAQTETKIRKLLSATPHGTNMIPFFIDDAEGVVKKLFEKDDTRAPNGCRALCRARVTVR